MSKTGPLSRIRLGTAPDSWGVWFPDDPGQIPWDRFLDEVATAGYEWIELGPYGYLPTDPEQLRDELGRRGLRLSGGAVFSGLHRGRDALKQAIEECRAEARLLTALGAKYLVSLPEGYTDLDGTLTQPVDLTPQQWKDLTSGMSELARVLREESGVELVFHPHADSHVDTQERVLRFLEDTDPEVVSLCLDTGHISYCGGDNIEIIRAFPERIGYVHLKQVDPEIVRQVREENLCFAEAVRRGAMIEPPAGVPAMEPLLAELGRLDADLFAIVEQDLYPCPAEVPLPIATRTRTYFNGCGLRP
ncbi:TIM barrel protein [Nonomuraea sp. SYSU D8015]|uniref:TIM barrel protein n=1 Tax=Nonomuraea sp. SYSU D8015 TaxID=2593644 RepID=UPI001CB6D250|nr:TIM barrel protein [Nonomuraea sp. SYSU D8015]